MQTTIELIPMTDTHLMWVMKELREQEVQALGPMTKKDMRERAQLYREQGVAWCALQNQQPLAVGGAVQLFPGCGEAWMLATPRVYDTPLMFTRICKAVINMSMDQLRLRRLQLNASKAMPHATRFARTLGFEFEGTMKCYGPDGSDFERYALCRVQ